MAMGGSLFKETLTKRQICHNSQQKYSNTDDRNFKVKNWPVSQNNEKHFRVKEAIIILQ